MVATLLRLPPSAWTSAEAAEDMGAELLWVLPSAARRRALVRALADAGGGSLPVLATPDSLHHLGPGDPGAPGLIRPAARRALAAEVLAEDAAPFGPAEDRPGRVRAFLRLLDDMRHAGLDRAGAPRVEAPEFDVLRTLLARYRARLAELDLEDSVERTRRFLAWLRAAGRGPGLGDWRGEALWVEAPGDLTPLERQVVAALARRARHLQVRSMAAPCGEVPFAREFAAASALAPEARVVEARAEVEGEVDLTARVFSDQAWPTPASRVMLVDCRDRREEVQVAAAMIRVLVEAGRLDDLAAVGLVVPAPEAYQDLVEEVLEGAAIDHDDQLPRPLEGTRVARLVAHLLEGLARGWPRRALVELLRSPLVDARAPGVPDLDPELLDQAARQAALRGGEAEWAEALAARQALHRAAARQTQDAPRQARRHASVADRLEAQQQALEVWFSRTRAAAQSRGAARLRAQVEGLLGDLGVLPAILTGAAPVLARREARALRRVLEALDEVVQAERLLEAPMDAAAFEAQARMALAGATFVDDAPTRAGVQVLRPEEARHGSWKMLILLGFDEGRYPTPPQRPPLVGNVAALRAAFGGLPAYRDEGREDLVRLLASRRHDGFLLATCPREDDGVPLVPAWYWTVLQEACVEPVQSAAFASGGSPRARQEAFAEGLLRPWSPGGAPLDPAAAASARRCATEPTARAFARRLALQRGRTMGSERFLGIVTRPALRAVLATRFSPETTLGISALEDLARCPFRFFSRHVLGLGVPDELVDQVDARARGEVVHDIVREFYQRWGRGLVPEDLPEAEALLQEVGARAYQGPETEGFFWQRERQRVLGGGAAPGVLQAWLTYEATRGDRGQPWLLEWGFGGGGPGEAGPLELVPDDGGGVGLRLAGRIDRVDRLPSGDFVVWDYKTGAVHKPILKLRAGIALQLPLYLLAVASLAGDAGAPLGAGFLHLRAADEVEPKGVFADGSRARPGGDYPMLAARGRPRTHQRWVLDPEGEGSLGALLGRLRRRVLQLADRARQGRFPATRHPQDRGCVKICEYRDLCRVEESAAFSEREAASFEVDLAEAPPEGGAA